MADEIRIDGPVGSADSLADSLEAEFELINKHDNDLEARTESLLESLKTIRVEFCRLYSLWAAELDPEGERKLWEAISAERKRRAEVIVAFLEMSNERQRLLAENKRIGAIAAEARKGLKLCSSMPLKLQ